MRIAVFLPNLIGDTVMATPTLRALRTTFPDATIDGVIKPHVSPTLDGTLWLNDRILFAPKAKDPAQRARAVIRRLRQSRYDAALLLPNSFRSAWLAFRSGIPRRLGYARGGRSLLLTDRLRAPLDARGRFLPTPVVEYYLALAHILGCRDTSPHLELATTLTDDAAADLAWHRLGLPEGRKLVCLNTGGAFGPAKSWPAAYFASLARRLVDEAGYSILVLCGPSERDAAREIVGLAGHPRVVSLADEPLSIGLSKASIRRSALLITTDSGPRHFAAGFGVPVVSLFGPTHIAWTRTYHPLAIHLQQRIPCGPCQQPVCPLGHHRCMNELLPEAVFAAALRLLNGRASKVQAIHGPASSVGPAHVKAQPALPILEGLPAQSPETQSQ